jgi:putative membrane protein
MQLLAWLAAFVAAAFHTLAFCMESLWWTRPSVRQRFRQTSEQADVTRVLAFNQGFYNLFLAAEIVAGFALVRFGHEGVGLALTAWSCLSMTAAALVLLASAPGMRRGAALQGVPPLVFLVLLALRIAA